MTSVTIESIAYVHFQVHFALSERETLDIKSDEFSYIVFYDHIVRFLHDHKEQPKSARKVSDLIEWWNQRIFPGYRVDSALTSGLNTLYPSTSLFSLALKSQSGSADQSVVKKEADEP
ncbi:hypothetical protein FRC03_006237 [Tulasnella sp. 419]|nr:hypothetical protein FRC03_006237 [Tulasnella sp. 419]